MFISIMTYIISSDLELLLFDIGWAKAICMFRFKSHTASRGRRREGCSIHMQSK